jgi:hypothetical protein
MKEISDETPVRLSVSKTWQVLVATVAGTAVIISWFYIRDNERQLREQEFRHLILDQMKGFMTYSAMNVWVDELERKNPSLVLPRIRQAAVEGPTKNSFQAASKGTSYVHTQPITQLQDNNCLAAAEACLPKIISTYEPE